MIFPHQPAGGEVVFGGGGGAVGGDFGVLEILESYLLFTPWLKLSA